MANSLKRLCFFVLESSANYYLCAGELRMNAFGFSHIPRHDPLRLLCCHSTCLKAGTEPVDNVWKSATQLHAFRRDQGYDSQCMPASLTPWYGTAHHRLCGSWDHSALAHEIGKLS